jgi:5-methylcytosine-specific restriction endonuclease McrA
MSKNISRRLVDDLKFKIFKEQSDLCLVCKKPIIEKSSLNRLTTVHFHHLVPRRLQRSLGIIDKHYEARRNLILLYGNCHLVLHKTAKINKSVYLHDEIPKYSITA